MAVLCRRLQILKTAFPSVQKLRILHAAAGGCASPFPRFKSGKKRGATPLPHLQTRSPLQTQCSHDGVRMNEYALTQVLCHQLTLAGGGGKNAPAPPPTLKHNAHEELRVFNSKSSSWDVAEGLGGSAAPHPNCKHDARMPGFG